jgi:hypothetical protein
MITLASVCTEISSLYLKATYLIFPTTGYWEVGHVGEGRHVLAALNAMRNLTVTGAVRAEYQGVADVIELPNDGCALVFGQRSSWLILHDMETGRQKPSIDLGGGGGNPRLELRDSGKEVWASDYDRLVVVSTGSWQVQRSSQLPRAGAGTQQFIGEFSFVPDQELCACAPVQRRYRGSRPAHAEDQAVCKGRPAAAGSGGAPTRRSCSSGHMSPRRAAQTAR